MDHIKLYRSYNLEDMIDIIFGETVKNAKS